MTRSNDLDRLRAVVATPSVVLVNCLDIEPQPMRWLWPDWLAQGKLHMLAGSPGLGKSTLAMSMAAIVASGMTWPCGSKCPRGNVLIWSGEDDARDTMLPRLMAAGADRARCYFVTGLRVGEDVVAFDPASHMPELEERARSVGDVRLIIVDPVVSAVAGDSHKNTEVRRALQPLVELAAKLDAVVIGITHTSKGGGRPDEPASRVIGSVAFSALPRLVMMVGRATADEGGDKRILARAKSNFGPDGGGFIYRVAQAEPVAGIHTNYVEWGEEVTGSSAELFRLTNTSRGSLAGEPTLGAVDAAKRFLLELLEGGVTAATMVQAKAEAAGLSWASVRRASEVLPVAKKKGAHGTSQWSLRRDFTG